MTRPTIASAAGLALLLPVLPFALEMLALRRMSASAFGTLIAVQIIGDRNRHIHHDPITVSVSACSQRRG